MMKYIKLPKDNEWASLIQRPTLLQENLSEKVENVFKDVQKNGDIAIHKYTAQFDKVTLKSIAVTTKEIENSTAFVSSQLKEAITVAKNNIEKFHLTQKEKAKRVETTAGVSCWRESRPIQKVGIYIPGGTAPLFSTVLMLGIPAKIAGCKDVILCSPPDEEGNINPVILYVSSLIGITRIYKVGGMQAIAALTFGTESIPKVDKIFGPGNQYVTAAKQLAQKYNVAIDMPAGPSEVLIIADRHATPKYVAADLLSQAEHGVDSQVILLSDNEDIVETILREVSIQLENLPRKELAKGAIENSKSIVLKSIEECIRFSNYYAPEHLILAVKNAQNYTADINTAGSVFLGKYSCESAGDYASGTNHTLPTNGFSRSYSGVSVDSFVKKITFQKLTKKGIQNIGPSIELMAEAEQLFAHKNAVTLRLNDIENGK
jgi:histidinol dehydrogenase